MPATIETIKSTIIPITMIFLVADFIDKMTPKASLAKICFAFRFVLYEFRKYIFGVLGF
jgi:hypothetical protein